MHGRKLGEIGYPANLYRLGEVCGHLGLDEKRNLHVAHGHGYPRRTGADYETDVHCDGVIRKGTLEALRSGIIFMRDGAYSPEVFRTLGD